MSPAREDRIVEWLMESPSQHLPTLVNGDGPYAVVARRLVELDKASCEAAVRAHAMVRGARFADNAFEGLSPRAIAYQFGNMLTGF